jgi:hypothetical protein
MLVLHQQPGNTAATLMAHAVQLSIAMVQTSGWMFRVRASPATTIRMCQVLQQRCAYSYVVL